MDKRYERDQTSGTLERETKTFSEYKEKVKQLEIKLALEIEQREILKDAAGILSQTPPKRLALIKTISAEHSITVLRQTLGVSRSGFYDWTKAKSVREASDNTFLLDIKQIHEKSRATYGSPVITKDLLDRGIRVCHNRVARLMREVGIVGRTKRRYRVRTTDRNHDQLIASNLLRDMPLPERPNLVWVRDITYIPTHEGWLYLAGVFDRYSRKLVGWSMDSNLPTRLPLSALKMAIEHRRPEPILIHHSDRGIQ